ncbi:MAG TPA: tol-pal system-associated acyl-CoA thioesterase [Candidatus Paenalcaligenes intestinipullorum]|uniref:Tol-pal system-associated acyl-CoA thioesterase n=1 Tax=Candidatus Paenalcaligenes intestinipullorum TaxID=2838718 RepID=A0A9D2U949_9BURK|nr:tol-pal system-associated acyl-CoA thioesterase [Candidatus Paenalcaligenes intestinipullorum]
MTENHTQTPHELYIRLYYEDTDAGGIVFYANYLKYFERARTEWLRSLGINQSQMVEETGQIFVVKQASLDYRRPARLDDLLCIRTRIEQLASASVTFAQQAWLDDTLLCSSQIQVVCVDAQRLRPTKFNPSLRLTLEKAQN